MTGLPLSRMCGRWAVKLPGHPHANNRGYVLRYRYVMEQKLGRFLKSNEEVHHHNENPLDDRLCNLELMSKDEHARLHMKKLDHDLIFLLKLEGLGAKRISKETGYKLSSVKSAIKRGRTGFDREK